MFSQKTCLVVHMMLSVGHLIFAGIRDDHWNGRRLCLYLTSIVKFMRLIAGIRLRHRPNNIAFANWTGPSTRCEPWCAKHIVSKVHRQNNHPMGSNLHALSMEFMPAGKTHDSALSIYILFKANNAFHLPSRVLTPP